MKSLYEQKANKCRHFNGLVNDACDVGVRYASVKLPRESGQGYNLPCFKDDGGDCRCEKQSFKTDAEIRAEIEESDKHFAETMTARKAIVEYLGGPWKKGMPSAHGTIDCPVCKLRFPQLTTSARLSFSRSGYNGHIHARCSTSGCVSWME